MNVRLKRAYEEADVDDGYRVLVDRVWPRGKTRDELRLDEWARDLGPTNELRKWFDHDPARFARLPRLARQLAVADFSAVYLALALDNERALRS